MARKVLMAAGGTGGHLFPAQQLAEKLRDKAEIVFAGHRLEKSPYFKKEFRYYDVPAEKLGWKFFFGLVVGLWKAIGVLRREKPDVVMGFGSFHTVPVLLAAVLLRKKLVLYEANRSLGKVNRLFARFGTLTGQFPLEKSVLVPLFPWVETKISREEARRDYGLDPKKKTILVFGGSQGAEFLNEIVPKAVEGLDLQVLHFGMKKNPYMRGIVKPFEENMAKAYAAADLAICRSGAGTITELLRYEVPALLIPYPFAYGHQEHNAQYLVELGLATMLLQKEATAEKIREWILTDQKLAFRKEEAQNRISFEELLL